MPLVPVRRRRGQRLWVLKERSVLNQRELCCMIWMTVRTRMTCTALTRKFRRAHDVLIQFVPRFSSVHVLSFTFSRPSNHTRTRHGHRRPLHRLCRAGRCAVCSQHQDGARKPTNPRVLISTAPLSRLFSRVPAHRLKRSCACHRALLGRRGWHRGSPFAPRRALTRAMLGHNALPLTLTTHSCRARSQLFLPVFLPVLVKTGSLLVRHHAAGNGRVSVAVRNVQLRHARQLRRRSARSRPRVSNLFSWPNSWPA